MDCYKDYIGLKGCCEDSPPASGLFINTLSGITGELLESLAEREQETGQLAYSDVQDIAARRFYTDTISKLRKSYRLKQIREEFIYRPDEDSGVNEGMAAEKRGVLLSFGVNFSTFQSFTVNKIYFIGQAAGAATVHFLDGDGIELYHKDFTAGVGLNIVSIDKRFNTRQLFIGIDATAVATMHTEFEANTLSCFCRMVQCLCGTCDAAIDGSIYDGSYETTAGNSHGMGVWGYSGCDYSSILCNNRELFTSAWLFLLGNQSIIELLNSSRINRYTTVDRERYTELRDFYQVQYEKELETALDGIVINTKEDCCVECEQVATKIQWLP